jgi:hypothetical protein
VVLGNDSHLIDPEEVSLRIAHVRIKDLQIFVPRECVIFGCLFIADPRDERSETAETLDKPIEVQII